MQAVPETMRAMVLEATGAALQARRVPVPRPGPRQVLIEVEACGVCRTDLHIVDGELAHARLPLIPGHEIVGRVVATGAEAARFAAGARVGVPWLGQVDGTCRFCARGQENLCAQARFTGYDIDGGYAQYTVADERFCFPLPAGEDAAGAAPLLCAGLIGYRAYRLAGTEAQRIGLYGFGAAAHILAQIALGDGRTVYAFTRPGDTRSQAFARKLGAAWAGDSTRAPPEPLDAAIIFAPVGALVVEALRATDKGGTVVCAGIHMSDIPAFPYRLLWEERRIRSVANLTRRDGDELFARIARAPVQTEIHRFPLEEANAALEALRGGRFDGAAVLDMQA